MLLLIVVLVVMNVNYHTDKFIFLDLETTGSNYRQERIIEIFALKVEGREVIDQFHTLLNPDRAINKFIQNLTGIKQDEVDQAPLFTDKVEELLDFLQDHIIVAHNARFDYSFLKAEFENTGKLLTNNYICSVKLSRTLYPQFRHHNLDSIIERIGLESGERHRAEYDTRAIYHYFEHALAEKGEKAFNSALNHVFSKAAIPSGIMKYNVTDLPNSYGVYMFLDKDSYPIYIGKSKHLKQRVLQHFYGDTTNFKEFQITQQLHDIQYIETAGEIGTSVREAALIKKFQPLYNKKLRRKRMMTQLIKYIDDDGYLNIEIAKKNTLDPSNLQDVVGVFSNKKSVELMLRQFATANKICPQKLGLEKQGSTCFAYQLGKCNGACKGEADAEVHNKRMRELFAEYEIKSWPYQKAIVVHEANGSLSEQLLFYNWCLFGSTYEAGSFDRDVLETFDIDIYRILFNQLQNHEVEFEEVDLTDKLLRQFQVG